ncbi:MAG: hypothetical protein A3J48_01295 [Candidatus Doudnabacteria bacterium RIFCSPHIGHO2_02_FULL_46_11]|uniref:Solute-binding protein family 5 domain-containing protein n=1 Tax=Candidatus Doudnabacteria bacterium RIFCSPHIGHO2_02_FULL_46_11 TaxID=1817832 RepID=A0A1F5P949_9BACT|nr:MAG: hypothetical protein A3J48_01295 [Candidatus Doudnabacteria bacterium RIFCSPHIGHO2_02_FULL_46_11]
MAKLQNIVTFYRLFSAREQKLFIILLCLGGVGLFGVLGSAWRGLTYTVPARGGEIIEGTLGQPVSLSPLDPATSDAEQDLKSLIHAGLLGVDGNGNFKPVLAENLPVISDDLKNYSLKLRNGLKWQDGAAITPEDVVHTIKTAQSKESASNLRYSFRFVKVEVLEDKTIKFTLRDPSISFSENLTLGLLPAHLESDYDDLNPVGAGPYKLEKFRYRSNQDIVGAELMANEFYHPHKPYIEKITFKFYQSTDDLIKAYNQGDIKSFSQLSDNENIKLQPGGRLIRASSPQYQTVFFNKEKNPLLGSLKIRQALKLATNRFEIVDNLHSGLAIAIGGPSLGEVAAPAPEYNLTRANELLSEEGWLRGDDGFRYKNDEQLKIVLTTNDIKINQETANLLAEQWQNLGLKLEINIVPRAELNSSVLRPREYQALLLSENLGHDPDPYFFWHSSQITDPGLNLSGFRNNEVDKIIVDARNTRDMEVRKQLYTRFTQIIDNEAAAVFLVQPFYTYITAQNIHNVDFKVLIVPQERFGNVAEWYVKTHRALKL